MAQMICSTCGSVGYPKTITKGSIGIEIILWLCFLVPGVLYSLWRLTTRRANGCPRCGSQTMIPLNSPVGQQMQRTLGDQNNKINFEQVDKNSLGYRLGKKFSG